MTNIVELKRFADNGNEDAMVEYGLHLFRGEGVPKNQTVISPIF